MLNNEFGKILKQLRCEKSLSQKAFGNALGVSRQSVGYWEKGEREPDLDTIMKIAEYFDVSINYLFGKED